MMNNHPFFNAYTSKVLEAVKKNKRKVARENSSTSNNKNRADLMQQNMRD